MISCSGCEAGFSLDELEGFREPPLMLAVCGNGGRGSKGDTLPPTKDGRRPGWEEDLFLPGICVDWLSEGREVFGILLVLGADSEGSTGEDDAVGGAEAFDRRK